MCTHKINDEFNYYEEYGKYYCIICDRNITEQIEKR